MQVRSRSSSPTARTVSAGGDVATVSTDRRRTLTALACRRRTARPSSTRGSPTTACTSAPRPTRHHAHGSRVTCSSRRPRPWTSITCASCRGAPASRSPSRWASTPTGTGPGKIEVYRAQRVGSVARAIRSLITDKSGSDFASDKAFGLAHALGRRAAGRVARVRRPAPARARCTAACSIRTARRRRSVRRADVDRQRSGEPVGRCAPDGAFVVAWNDSSGLEPDRSGSAVRARIVYPPTTP